MAVLPAAMTLLEAAKLGDDNAFEILLQPLLEPGYRLAGGMLQDHQAAQDAVQEAAFKAWRKLRLHCSSMSSKGGCLPRWRWRL
jgi:DNA-directed RNA polymerase specialized sigma24 family protein